MRGAVWTAVRLVAAALAFAVSLLAVVPAPTHFLWMVSVVATEWGHVLAALVVVLLACGTWRGAAGRTTVVLCALAVVLALSPLARALLYARELPAAWAKAFGGSAGAAVPVSARTLFAWGGPAADVTTLTYVERADGPLALDLYRPPDRRGPSPAVVVIHGGFWRAGDRGDLPALNAVLAARGYVVAAPTYRLAPAHPFPAARDDVWAVVAFLRARAADLGVDPNRIALLGRSAGGELALVAAYAPGAPPVRGVIAFYAPTDLRWSWDHPRPPALTDTHAVLREYLGGTPDTLPIAYDAASATYLVGLASVPTLLVHGVRDELVSVDESDRLDARLVEHRRPHFYLRMPWATHGCDVNPYGPCGQLSTWAVERFLDTVLR